jgi:phosphate transport system substrate-binding protein
MKRLLGLLMATILVLAGCSSTDTAIAAGGSTSVNPLFSAYIDEYTAEYPGVDITYDGQGSSKGIEGVNNGTYQIGALSRELKESEKNADITEKTIALDGIAVVVSQDNPVDSLTLEQVQQIYTGEITNWSEVGGNDETISVVSRDAASGTREAFETIVGFGKGDDTKPLTSTAIEFNSEGGVAESVANNPSGIGYISIQTYDENSDELKAIAIDGVEATEENAKNASYPLVRPFVIVYKEAEIDEATKEFIMWIDENAATIAEEEGYISAE